MLVLLEAYIDSPDPFKPLTETQYQKFDELIVEALEQYPEESLVWFWRGWGLQFFSGDQEQFEWIEHAYERATVLDPKNYSAWMMLAYLHWDKERRAALKIEVEQFIEAGQRDDPDFPLDKRREIFDELLQFNQGADALTLDFTPRHVSLALEYQASKDVWQKMLDAGFDYFVEQLIGDYEIDGHIYCCCPSYQAWNKPLLSLLPSVKNDRPLSCCYYNIGVSYDDLIYHDDREVIAAELKKFAYEKSLSLLPQDPEWVTEMSLIQMHTGLAESILIEDRKEGQRSESNKQRILGHLDSSIECTIRRPELGLVDTLSAVNNFLKYYCTDSVDRDSAKLLQKMFDCLAQPDVFDKKLGLPAKMLGSHYYRHRKRAEAIPYLKLAIQNGYDTDEVLIELALAYLALDQFRECIDTLESLPVTTYRKTDLLSLTWKFSNYADKSNTTDQIVPRLERIIVPRLERIEQKVTEVHDRLIGLGEEFTENLRVFDSTNSTLDLDELAAKVSEDIRITLEDSQSFRRQIVRTCRGFLPDHWLKLPDEIQTAIISAEAVYKVWEKESELDASIPIFQWGKIGELLLHNILLPSFFEYLDASGYSSDLRVVIFQQPNSRNPKSESIEKPSAGLWKRLLTPPRLKQANAIGLLHAAAKQDSHPIRGFLDEHKLRYDTWAFEIADNLLKLKLLRNDAAHPGRNSKSEFVDASRARSIVLTSGLLIHFAEANAKFKAT